MNVPMLKAIHEARRAVNPEGGMPPFDEATPEQIEELKAEVAAYVQDGTDADPLLKAIVDALK